MGRLADFAAKVFPKHPPPTAGEPQDDADEGLTICDALQGALEMTNGLAAIVPMLTPVHTACTEILKKYRETKNNTIECNALMQRIATTVDIINSGLAGLSKDGLRMLQQKSSTFLEALIKFNTELVKIKASIDDISELSAWGRWVRSKRIKGDLEKHRVALQRHMYNFVLTSTVGNTVTTSEIEARIKRLEQQDADRRARSRRVETVSATQANADAKEDTNGEPFDVARHGRKRAVLRQAGLDAVPPIAAYIIDASLWFIVPWWRANFG